MANLNTAGAIYPDWSGPSTTDPYGLNRLRGAITNQYDTARTKTAMENANLVSDTEGVIGRQLSKAGVKGTLASAAQRQGTQEASKVLGKKLQDIEAEKTGKLDQVNEEERQQKIAEDKANTELLFKVLGGVGSLASTFIPFADLGKQAFNIPTVVPKDSTLLYPNKNEKP